MEDILDFKAIKKELNIDFPSPKDFKTNFSLYFNAVKQLTVKDYFKYTPGNESILQDYGGCTVRYPKRWAIKHPWPKAKECYQMFEIKKYLHRGMVCYMFDFETNHQSVSMEEYSLVPEMSNVMYKIYLNKTIFGKLNSYSIFLHGENTSKLYDSVFSPKRYVRSTDDDDLLNIDVTYSSITTTLLETPYDTNCKDIEGFNSMAEHWFHRLRKKFINRIGIVDTFAPIYDLYDLPLLGSEYFVNQSVLQQVNQIYNNMESEQNLCINHHYASKQVVSYTNNVRIGVYWPEEYFIVINHVEEQLLIDYIVYVCSSIGIWFGLSFCSLITPIEKKTVEEIANIGDNRIKIREMFHYFKLVTNDLKKSNQRLKQEVAILKNRW